MKVRINTTVEKEWLRKFAELRREGIRVNDLIAIALRLYETNPEAFYMYAYFVKREKEEKAKARP